MHLLRERMGDSAFWQGLQRYKQRFWGQAVTSRDFQAAMQSAHQCRPGTVFDDWVYGSKR